MRERAFTVTFSWIEDGVLPAEVTEVAEILTTRVEPEIFVPPRPGDAVRLARGVDRDQALFFDGMEERVVAGASRDGEPVFINLEFLDGRRGAHVNISGVSGVATKTTYATFLLYSLFTKGLGRYATNSKALIFNVKGEDLLFLDHPNALLDEQQAQRYRDLDLEPGAFDSAEFWAPPRPGDPNAAPDVGRRDRGIHSFFWTLAAFCEQELLSFLFADAGDERQQYTMVVHNVAARLKREAVSQPDGYVTIEGRDIRTFQHSRRIRPVETRRRGRARGTGMGRARDRRRDNQCVPPAALRSAPAHGAANPWGCTKPGGSPGSAISPGHRG